MTCDYLIVGAGFFGSVLAERIANDLGAKVVIIDKRPHIGGNCYSGHDYKTGIEYHAYGTHIFHTSSEEVLTYITRFTDFNNYRHQTLTTSKGRVYQMPINLETINTVYNRNFKPEEAKEFLQREITKAGIKNPKNIEEKAISLVGRKLYTTLIKGYTIKQWGRDPKELPPEIISRLPVRYNYREDYYHDAQWQGIPIGGYTKIFKKMMDSPRINVILECDFFKNRDRFNVKKKVIYTGPIDKYFNYAHGQLEWRSVQFQRRSVNVDDYQGAAVMNFADAEIKYTRIHEPKHLHPERKYTKNKTIIFYEYPNGNTDEPYYPINTIYNQRLYSKYRDLAKKIPKLIIGGRLGDYAYYDMDKTILAALRCYTTKICGDTHG
jgi:UDP-galactopyranose mutase